MYIINSLDELTQDKICSIIQKHNTEDRPRLQNLENYYLGKHKILQRQMTDSTKPNNKVVINYPALICDSYSSYLCGSPVSYTGDEGILETLQYSDVADLDLETARNINIFGFGVNQSYIDSSKQTRFVNINPKEVIFVYDGTVENNILAVIRYYTLDESDSQAYHVEVWDSAKCSYYKTNNAYSALEFVNEQLHFFKDVPFIEFLNNSYRQSSFEEVITLIDGLEKLTSDEVNTFEQFCDCYMILKGCVMDDNDLQEMKVKRVIQFDGIDASIEYLTKEVNIEQITALKQDFVTNIHKISCVPDMSDENFANNASGVAIRYKLLSFENETSQKERKFKKGLQRRIKLIENMLNIISKTEYLDVKIAFTRNLPVNEVEQGQLIGNLRGLVSDETLLSQISFVDDVDAELKLLKEQQKVAASLYSFGGDEADEE